MFKSKLLVLLGLVLLLLAMGCRKKERLPDLVVQSIDVSTLTVNCPGGAGTCVTTVTFTIANTGVGDASTFNVRIAFDPNQTVIVNQPVTVLSAGATQTFTISSPPGDNCFDPDCTVCVTVDDGNSVTESDESNNQTCETKMG